MLAPGLLHRYKRCMQTITNTQRMYGYSVRVSRTCSDGKRYQMIEVYRILATSGVDARAQLADMIARDGGKPTVEAVRFTGRG